MRRFHGCRYGFVALGIGVAEIAFIWGSLAVVYALGLWGDAPHWLGSIFGVVYLAGLVALAVAAIGLRKDSRRRCAGVALLLGVLNLVVCAIPIVGLR